jgi:hypothetical protein
VHRRRRARHSSYMRRRAPRPPDLLVSDRQPSGRAS